MTSSRTALDPLDLFDIRAQLTEEERMVQDSVGRMIDEKVLPIQMEKPPQSDKKLKDW